MSGMCSTAGILIYVCLPRTTTSPPKSPECPQMLVNTAMMASRSVRGRGSAVTAQDRGLFSANQYWTDPLCMHPSLPGVQLERWMRMVLEPDLC